MMSTIYHYPGLNFQVPNHWITEKEKQGIRCKEGNNQWIDDHYKEYYGALVRIGRLALGILLSCSLFIFAFESGRILIRDLLFNSVKNIHVIRTLDFPIKEGEEVDMYVSMAGNPVHMGHMHMVALAVNRLVAEGYQINTVRVDLSEEEYLRQKVFYSNLSIEKHNQNPNEKQEMFRVLIPRDKRIEFLQAAIKQAKVDGTFSPDLNIDYGFMPNGRKVFHVWGADLVEDMVNFGGEQGNFKHAVIVTREGKIPSGISEIHRDDYSRLIVDNPNQKTSQYSSSKIQNGAYEQLPESVREEFKKMHEAAQPKNISTFIHEERGVDQNVVLEERLEEINKMRCLVARETAIATTRGFYTAPSGKEIRLRTGEQLLGGSRLFPNAILQFSMKPKYEKCTVAVINRDCLEAAQEEFRKGAQRVAVLMLASPIEPGGGMEDGNNGQEEDLCRRSDIFGFMWDQAHFTATHSLYNLVDIDGPDAVNPQYSSMKNNRMIHVPQVTVFRTGKEEGNDYEMLEEPFEVGILVSPGLNRPEYVKENGKTRYTRQEDDLQLRKLIGTQLKVAYEENYDTVILGAFGCGAFCNPPELIARYYKDIIDTHCKGTFKKIVFAILDDGGRGKHNPEGNLKPFQRCFESN